MPTVDGFPIQDNINWLPDKPDQSINRWSFGKTIKVEVVYGEWWYNFLAGKYAKKVTWKGKTITVLDYEWFLALIKQWTEDKFYPRTKEEALDLYFEMDSFTPNYK